jgi:hypothetical protein
MSYRAANGRSLLLKELERAVALESQLHELVCREWAHEELERHPCAIEWLERLEPRIYAHGAALEETLERLFAGQRQSLASCPIRLPAVPGAALRSDLDVAYALLSASIASYVVVGILAGVVGDCAVVALAQQHSDEADAFLDELGALTVNLARREQRAGALAELSERGEA